MTAYYQQPLKLVWNKLIRYPGGREIDRFQFAQLLLLGIRRGESRDK